MGGHVYIAGAGMAGWRGVSAAASASDARIPMTAVKRQAECIVVVLEGCTGALDQDCELDGLRRKDNLWDQGRNIAHCGAKGLTHVSELSLLLYSYPTIAHPPAFHLDSIIPEQCFVNDIRYVEGKHLAPALQIYPWTNPLIPT